MKESLIKYMESINIQIILITQSFYSIYKYNINELKFFLFALKFSIIFILIFLFFLFLPFFTKREINLLSLVKISLEKVFTIIFKQINKRANHIKKKKNI